MMHKKIYFFGLLSLILTTAFTIGDAVLERIGVEETQAKQYVMNNLLGNFDRAFRPQADAFLLPRAKLLSQVIAGDKVGTARELCTWMRTYVGSAEFREAYARRREELKPAPISEAAKPDEETIQMTRESIREMEKQLAEMKKQKGMPAASIQSVEQTLAGMKQNMAIWSGNSPDLQRWELLYPADPAQLVQKRLQDYLALSATVDFGAALTSPDRYGVRKFVNPEYEKKSNQWKAVYRAGKEVNEAVRAYVTDWLKTDFTKTAATTPAAAAAPRTQTRPAAPKTTKPATQSKGRNPRTGK